MKPEHTDSKSTSKSVGARIAGSGLAAGVEIVIFHPIDTLTKRLMTNQTHIQGLSQLNSVIFRESAQLGVAKKVTSLYQGLGYATGYKICQRIYKFAGQSVIKDIIQSTTGNWFTSTFGKKKGEFWMQGLSGAAVGVGEIVLLPFDVLKIKKQTNPDVFKGKTTLGIFASHWRELWRGAGVTALRNAPGSFALFGANSAVYQFWFHLDNPKKATVTQTLIASAVGSITSVVVASPMDVIKTRIQKAGFGENAPSGFTVVSNLLKEEGFSALFRGIVPKVLTVAPKLIFGFTLAQRLMNAFEARV